MDEEPTIAASLAGESPAALADIHDESARDNGLLTEANDIIDALPWGQASILRRAFRVASKYGGMDPSRRSRQRPRARLLHQAAMAA